jgi:prepilin-type N-terminal cleavage/methylation domain-containing protein
MIINAGTHCGTRRRGFTLAEAMMAVVVLGIAAAGVLIPFVSGTAVRLEGIQRTLAARLASNLMEQIIRRPFHDPNGTEYDDIPGPDPGGTGFAAYDNIYDFYGYAEAEGQIKDATGAVFTDPMYANFSRNVICDYVYVPPQPAESDPAKCEFISITVKVNYNGKEMAAISRLVSE